MSKSRKENKIERGKVFRFTSRERRALLMLLPLIAVLVWILWSASRPKFDSSIEVIGDQLVEGRISVGGTSQSGTSSEGEITLFSFDPNTVSYEELRSLGITPGTAAGIIKYRERGKVFQIPEEFAACYGIADSTYAKLKPYIIIGERFRLKNRSDVEKGESTVAHSQHKKLSEGSQDSVTIAPFDPNSYRAEDFVALGFSHKQAEVIVKYRHSIGGFKTSDDFARCYVVSPEMFERLRAHITFVSDVSAGKINGDKAGSSDSVLNSARRFDIPSEGLQGSGKIDLNSADSVALISVRGIGARSASAILSYRESLGGFHSIEQLTELKVITEKNYELICQQIYVDSFHIKKIDINFALPNAVAGHPYISNKMLRKVLKNRQLKGGWSTIEEMIEDNTLTSSEAAKLAPYLQFTMQAH